MIQANAQNQKTADSIIIKLENEIVVDSIMYEWLYEVTFNHSNAELKLKYARDLLTLAEKNNDPVWIYKGWFNIGKAYRLQGDLSEAAKAYFRCIEMAEKLSSREKIGEAFMELGNIYSIEGNHVNSIRYYNKAIDIIRNMNNELLLGGALLNAGDEYFNADKLDSAILYFEESGKIFENQNYLVGTAYNLGNVGMVYAKQDQPEKAESNMQRAIEILTELGDYYPIAVYDTYISDIYLEKGDFERALEYAQHSLDISMEHGLKEQIRDASLKLSSLYELKEDYKSAFTYQKQYLAYRDSINNEETIRKMADLRTEYEVSQKQTEIDLLESKQGMQNIIFASMTVAIILLTFIAFMYYRNNKRKQMLNQIIMDRKEEAEAQRDQLEAINDTREKFLSIIAHDLMGPVNSFKGFSTIMRFSIDEKDTDTLNEMHGQFEKSVNGLSNLLTDLLDWSVTQQGNIPYNPEVVDLKMLADELVDLFNNMAQTKNIELNSTIKDKIDLNVDLNSVKTILRNLVSNAIKFTSDGGSISVSAELADGYAHIKVADTGIGMSQDKITSLLNNAEYDRSWGTKGEKGLGLGLQLVKEFTEMNKGEMSIESEEGKGTAISVKLPLNN